MKVKLNYIYAGPRGAFKAGQIIDLPDAEAQGLIEAKAADAIEVTQSLPPEIMPVLIETTELPPAPETATIKPQKVKAKKRR